MIRSRRHLRIVVGIVSVVLLLVGPSAAISAQASTQQIKMSTQCLNAADITDNGNDVWVLCEGVTTTTSNMIEIDVHSGKIVKNQTLSTDIVTPEEIVSNAHYLWIIGQGGEVGQYATPSGTLVRVLTSPDIPLSSTAITATADSLWISDRGEHHIVEISAATGHVIAQGAPDGFAQPLSVVASGHYVWVLDQVQSTSVPEEFNYTLTLLTTSGAVVRRMTLFELSTTTQKSKGILEMPDSLTATPSDVWVNSAQTGAIEVSAATGHVVRQYKSWPTLGTHMGYHLMAVVGAKLLVVSPDPALFELNVNTAKVIGQYGLAGYFFRGGDYAIATDKKYVWAMNANLGQLAEFKLSNGDLLRVYS